MEEVILISLILLTLLTIFCLYKMLDKRGLYFALVILELVTFILEFKITNVFKMNINISIAPYIATLTVFYIFLIKYGYKEIKNLLKVSLYACISSAFLIAITNYFVPAITETISINMEATFLYNYKILIIYPFMMLLSQYITSKLYTLVSNLQSNVIVNIILTYIITGLIYTVVFYIVSYINILEVRHSLFIGISTYIIGIAITLINIIFITYIVKNKKVIK